MAGLSLSGDLENPKHAIPRGTLLAVVITYPSAEVRDMVLATGMADGMETSYARLEREVLAVA